MDITHQIQLSLKGSEGKAGCAECLREAPNSGKLEWGWWSVGSQLHHITCLHPSPEWAGLSFPLLILAAAVIFLQQHLPTFLTAATEDKQPRMRCRAQDLCSGLRLWVMLKGDREKKGEILLLPDSEAGTKYEVQPAAGGWGVGTTTESSIQCFKPSPAAAVTHLSEVLESRWGCSAAQEEFSAPLTFSRDRLLASWSIHYWIQQTRPPAGPYG